MIVRRSSSIFCSELNLILIPPQKIYIDKPQPYLTTTVQQSLAHENNTRITITVPVLVSEEQNVAT